MIESFVDLTYRGLSLGRRVRLSQVRPSTGYLELSAPMPVGARIAVAADDGAAFEAMVTAIHEQVTGSDRIPGMTVAPALADPGAAAWWTARVTLADDESLRPRSATTGGRSRPVTVRPRARTTPPPLPGTAAIAVPAIIADLDARVSAAAGLPRPAPRMPATEDPYAARTLVMPLHEIEAIAARTGEADGEPGPAPIAGAHAVADDGDRTVLMASIDPALLGIDLGAAEPTGATEPADDGDGDGDGGNDDRDGDDAEVTDPSPAAAGDRGALDEPPTAQPPGGRSRRKSRKLRR